jgi:hypothetical protein
MIEEMKAFFSSLDISTSPYIQFNQTIKSQIDLLVGWNTDRKDIDFKKETSLEKFTTLLSTHYSKDSSKVNL